MSTDYLIHIGPYVVTNGPADLQMAAEDLALDQWNEELSPVYVRDDVRLWVDNMGQRFGHVINAKEYPSDALAVQITPHAAGVALSKFRVHYSNRLEQLRAHFGDDNVEVHWGIVHNVF